MVTGDSNAVSARRAAEALEAKIPKGWSAAVLTSALRGSKRRYALTGAFAAQYVAPAAPQRLAAAYVDDPIASAKEFGLKAVEAGANVLLIEPGDGIAFEGATSADDGTVLVATPQLAADLLNLPGRGDDEIDAVLAKAVSAAKGRRRG